MAEGQQKGEVMGEARAILNVLAHRNISVNEDEAARILSCHDDGILKQYWQRVFTVNSVVELLGE
ncbi:MAG: hypothetical protein JW841_10065 [Deltaproteobacteria bacterium]|nr:hypothetical protein [Deltaproteobacteria bacterium]